MVRYCFLCICGLSAVLYAQDSTGQRLIDSLQNPLDAAVPESVALEVVQHQDSLGLESLRLPEATAADPKTLITQPLRDTTGVQDLGESRIQGKRMAKEPAQAGLKTMSRQEMKLVPATMNDPLRSLQVLPGVTAGNDLSVLPFVRGGDWTEVAMTWNGLPLIYPVHLGSAFSVLSLEGLEAVNLRTGYVQPSQRGTLSGLVEAEQRRSSGPWQGRLNMDWMRLGFWSGGSIPGATKSELELDISAQLMYFNYTIKGLSAFTYLWVDAEEREAIQDFMKFVQYPTAADLQSSLRGKGPKGIRWEWNGAYLFDGMHFLDSRQLLTENNVEIESVDTLAYVGFYGTVQQLFLKRDFGADQWQQSFAFQGVGTRVVFDAQAQEQAELEFDRGQMAWSSRSEWSRSLGDRVWNAGFAYEGQRDRYVSRMPRLVYKLLFEGSLDLADAVAQFRPEGFVIRQSEANYIDASEYMESFRMDYDAVRVDHLVALYGQHSRKLSDGSLWTAGVRLESDVEAKDPWAAPRLAWQKKWSTGDQADVYVNYSAQRDQPFYYKAVNADLKSAKAWHLGGEWSREWTPSFKTTLGAWTKKYEDLPVPYVETVGEMDWNAAADDLKELAVTLGLDTSWVADVEVDPNWMDQLPEELRTQFEAFGDKELIYRNNGEGWAYGTEFAIEAGMEKLWKGRYSIEWERSWRRDSLSVLEYSFAKSRPWKLKLFHQFFFGEKHSLALRYQALAGFPYTEMLANEGDTILAVGPRLQRNYMPYHRFDVRMARKTKWWGKEVESYLEVWNAWGSPNAFLRDSETGRLRFFDLNAPVATVFGGFDLKF